VRELLQRHPFYAQDHDLIINRIIDSIPLFNCFTSLVSGLLESLNIVIGTAYILRNLFLFFLSWGLVLFGLFVRLYYYTS
jgi:hypothetical protein